MENAEQLFSKEGKNREKRLEEEKEELYKKKIKSELRIERGMIEKEHSLSISNQVLVEGITGIE